MRGLWAVALAVTAMFVPFGTARAQFVGIPKPASIIVTVTKSDQHMIVTIDGKPRFKWSVSTGARGYATPSGRYKVSWLDEHHNRNSTTTRRCPMRFSSMRAKPSMASLAMSADPHRTAACGSRPATPKLYFVWSSSSEA